MFPTPVPINARAPYQSAVLATVLVLTCGCVSGDRDTGNEAGTDNAAVDALFADFDQPGSPGCGLAVAREGNLIYSRGYGYANLDHGIRNNPDILFDVGSVTKQFTAAGISMLALEGKLSLDDDILEWLPELPAYDVPITVRHLLHHTGGLRDYLNLFPLSGRDDYFPISHAQILAMMARQRAPIFPAGERYQYSNTGYMLLAQILERAGGQSLGEMAQERIFDPLGMDGSHMYEDVEQIVPRRAIGYDRNKDGELRIVHNYNFDVTGDGQLYITMPDLLRWDDWLHGNEPPEIQEMMLTEGNLNNGDPVGYAQGISLDEHRGLRTVGHGGGSWGFVTQLVRYVEPRVSIAISCNAGYARPGQLAEQVAELYLADQLDPEADAGPRPSEQQSSVEQSGVDEPTPLTASQMSELTGEYSSTELDATYRFAVESGDLVVRIEQDPPLSLTPHTDGTMKFRFGGRALSGSRLATLQFRHDNAGRVIGFGLSSGSEHGIVFERR